MEQTPIPPEGEALDREVFERVWRRVMPQDRPDCPFTLEPPVPESAPAPIPLPEEEAGAAPTTGQQAAPVMTPQAMGNASQAAQSAPMEARMEVPATPSEVCLGQASAGELPRLETLLTLVTDGARIYRSLAHRTGSTTLAALSREKSRQTRRLSTARMLIAGSPFTPPPTAAPGRMNLPAALRERFQAENKLFGALERAAEGTADPCLAELYRTLAAETQGHIRRLWKLAEGL